MNEERLYTEASCWDLIADIGGTHARVASVSKGQVSRSHVLPTSHSNSLLDVLKQFVSSAPSRPRRAVIAVAGVVNRDHVVMTNASQRLEIEPIRALTSRNQVQLLNDFEAASWALTSITPQDTNLLRGPGIPPAGNRLIIGPGTGLGVGALIKSHGSVTTISGEGGHIGISPQSEFEVAVFNRYRHLWPEVFFGDRLRMEAEAFLSGSGLPFLYQSICEVLGERTKARNTESILNLRSDASSRSVIETIALFRSYLGQIAGDLSLTVMAKGGVFIAGGVATKNPWLFDQTFLDAFDDGGRFTGTRKAFPIYLLKGGDIGLTGARNVLLNTSSPD